MQVTLMSELCYFRYVQLFEFFLNSLNKINYFILFTFSDKFCFKMCFL